ncbi:IclR family transcriptional regulator [Alcaligenes endophyticus]|uniref:IclR family transcriptional regulator n=1 Tax=Alcaligenes endophyticus TaxID=1929088 RepID=A0ABT8EFZ5_9BURK|nr:IclR family transcriptional regulator [Alcaligenes endophyticus]MCX5590165.1 IclR family transcriptional regulator [Alcaligenes endophyticus]MDN4120172.1 IclR family transcriptional regulator [Alcaligenes endophyticus]
MQESPIQNESVLERQLRVLELLAQYPAGLAFSEILRVLDFPKATLHRILAGLMQSGCVETSPVLDGNEGVIAGRRTYALGQRIQRLLAVAISPNRMASVSQRVLYELVEEFHETAFLCMLRGTQIESIAMATPPKDWHGYVNPGHVMPPQAAASAKAILAFRSLSEQQEILQEPFAALTDKTLVSRAAINDELAQVRRLGIAWCREEIAPGLVAVAAPIPLAQLGVLFSVSIVGPFERMKSHDEIQIGAALQEAASKLAAIFAQEMNVDVR